MLEASHLRSSKAPSDRRLYLAVASVSDCNHNIRRSVPHTRTPTTKASSTDCHPREHDVQINVEDDTPPR